MAEPQVTEVAEVRVAQRAARSMVDFMVKSVVGGYC